MDQSNTDLGIFYSMKRAGAMPPASDRQIRNTCCRHGRHENEGYACYRPREPGSKVTGKSVDTGATTFNNKGALKEAGRTELPDVVMSFLGHESWIIAFGALHSFPCLFR